MFEMLNALRSQIKEDNQESLRKVEENITENINRNFNEKFSRVDEEITKIQITQETHEKQLEYFDKKLRQRNLILFGFTEEEKSYQELEELALKIINYKLEIECDRKEIEFIGRMGKKNTKPRPIRLTLTTYGKKIAILQKKKVLEGSGSYIKEDYPPKVLEIRKSLLPQLKEHKEKGVYAILKYDKIVIRENGHQSSNKRAHSNSPIHSEDLVNSKANSAQATQVSKKTKTSSSNNRPKAHKLTPGTSQSITSFMKRTMTTEKNESLTLDNQ